MFLLPSLTSGGVFYLYVDQKRNNVLGMHASCYSFLVQSGGAKFCYIVFYYIKIGHKAFLTASLLDFRQI